MFIWLADLCDSPSLPLSLQQNSNYISSKGFSFLLSPSLQIPRILKAELSQCGFELATPHSTCIKDQKAALLSAGVLTFYKNAGVKSKKNPTAIWLSCEPRSPLKSLN
uniref:Uncharacterized protein n=1 Tax=Sphaerodactylus townsendi TaxID=933632 RepID=A0ACB8G001_9SAUR